MCCTEANRFASKRSEANIARFDESPLAAWQPAFPPRFKVTPNVALFQVSKWTSNWQKNTLNMFIFLVNKTQDTQRPSIKPPSFQTTPNILEQKKPNSAKTFAFFCFFERERPKTFNRGMLSYRDHDCWNFSWSRRWSSFCFWSCQGSVILYLILSRIIVLSLISSRIHELSLILSRIHELSRVLSKYLILS